MAGAMVYITDHVALVFGCATTKRSWKGRSSLYAGGGLKKVKQFHRKCQVWEKLERISLCGSTSS